RHPLAAGDDLAAAAGGLGHAHVFCLASLRFDHRARRRAANLLVRDVEMGHAKRRSLAFPTKQSEGVKRQIRPALHVIDAGAEGTVAFQTKRQTLDEAKRMNRVEVA